jgi:hypothetical protein
MKKLSVSCITSIILVCALTGLIVSGCASPKARILGKWECVKSEISPNKKNSKNLADSLIIIVYGMTFSKGSTLEFFKNNTVTLGSLGANAEYNWADGSNIVIKGNGSNNSMTFEVMNEGGSLALSNDIISLAYTQVKK